MPPSARVCLALRARLTILPFICALALHAADGQITSPGNKKTPELQAYLKIVWDSIGARWYSLVVQNADSLPLGIVEMDFSIDGHGDVKKLHVIGNTAGHLPESVAREAIEQTHLPPIPKPLMRQLHSLDLECDVKFAVFDNKSGSSAPPR